jgi:hypothetical protein
LRRRNGDAAIAGMGHHLGSVEHRALLNQDRDSQFDLGEVLSRYVEVLDTGNLSKLARLPRQKGRATK